MSNTTDESANAKKDKIVIYFLASNIEADIEACETVLKHLKPFFRNAKTPIEILSDNSIIEGHDKVKYKERLYEADLVLAFGSIDLIIDEEIYERMEKVIDRYNKKETRLLGILVRNFTWDEPFFDVLPILPTSKRPLLDKSQEDFDNAFTQVAVELREVIKTHYSVERVTEVRPRDDKNKPSGAPK